MRKQKVFLIGSSYGLLLALLAFPVSHDDVFIFNGNVISKRISDELGKDYMVYVRQSNSSCKGIIGKIVNLLAEEKRYRKYIHSNISDNSNIIGHDHVLAIAYPFWGKFSTIIEDGYISYLRYEEILSLMKKKGAQYYRLLNFWYKLRTGNDYKLYGYDQSINKVLLTDSSKDIPGLYGKIEFCSVEGLWKEFTPVKQKRLIEIFQAINLRDEMNNYNSINLLITQPLSEDGLMTEKEKIDLYSSILINRNNFFIIKPHPREMTDYHNLFPSSFIIDNDIPLEIIALMAENISKVYTCFSTAAKIFEKKAEINYISLLKYPRIIEKYNLYEIQDKVK